MSILDDAIREHLDLKRKHGARDAEIRQLEDEAFGPPSRPDEPDFPERPPTGELETAPPAEPPVAADDVREDVLAEAPSAPAEVPPPPAPEEIADAPVAEAPGFYDQVRDAPSELDVEAIASEPTAEHAVSFDHEDEPDEVPPVEALEPEPAPVEPAPEVPASEEPVPEEPVPTEPAAEETVPEEPTTAEPAAATPEAGDFEIGEIELELDEEFEEFRETSDPVTADEDEDELEAGLEADDAVPPLGEPAIEPESPGEPAPVADEPEADEGEDVLEETPEFLRGTPEDERLWFEQGAPQDFDFEDEDEDEA